MEEIISIFNKNKSDHREMYELIKKQKSQTDRSPNHLVPEKGIGKYQFERTF